MLGSTADEQARRVALGWGKAQLTGRVALGWGKAQPTELVALGWANLAPSRWCLAARKSNSYPAPGNWASLALGLRRALPRALPFALGPLSWCDELCDELWV